MFSLPTIKQLNEQAVAEHDPALLEEEWPEGEAQLAISEASIPPPNPASPQEKRPIFLTVEGTVEFAEVALGFDFSGLRRGLGAVLRAERGEATEPDAMTLFAFACACAPALVAEWTTALTAKVKRYEVWTRVSSFTLVDNAHAGARIHIVDREVVGVSPPPRKKSR